MTGGIGPQRSARTRRRPRADSGHAGGQVDNRRTDAEDADTRDGAPDDMAREAAEEIAGFEDRLTGIESDLKLLKWMLGFNLALSMAVAALLLRALAP